MRERSSWVVGIAAASSGLMIALAALAQSEAPRNIKEEQLLALEDEIGAAFEIIIESAESRSDLEKKIQRFLSDNEELLQEQSRDRAEIFRRKMGAVPPEFVEPVFETDEERELYESEKRMAATVDGMMAEAKSRRGFEEGLAKFLEETQELREEQSRKRGQIFDSKRDQRISKQPLFETDEERDLYEKEKQMAATFDGIIAKAKDRGGLEDEIAKFLDETQELREEQSNRRGEIFISNSRSKPDKKENQRNPKLKNNDK